VRLSKVTAWTMSLALFAAMVAVPYVYYRANYIYAKRLRPVVEGRLYRSGCMTSEGFEAAIRAHGIRTIINVMDDDPDPALSVGYFKRSGPLESELCARLNVKMVQLTLDLMPPSLVREQQPVAIKEFLDLMDRPETYPALIHCRAGLHRTGVMVAVFRMEYQGWTNDEAMRELKAHGFGEFAATKANEYIDQYVLRHHPRGIYSERHLAPFRVHGGIGPGF
jgi:tyrosine-protein phosphatase SIW14